MPDGVNKLVSVTMPQDWKDAAQKLAKEHGLSLSELFRQLIYEQLSKTERKKLSTPLERGKRARSQT